MEALDTTDRLLTLHGMVRRIEEITRTSWMALGNQSKNHGGYETLPQQRLKFCGTYPLTEDAKLFIFRFDTHRGRGKGRIIGFKKNPCSAYYVIGIDLEFKAYDHGA